MCLGTFRMVAEPRWTQFARAIIFRYSQVAQCLPNVCATYTSQSADLETFQFEYYRPNV